MKVELTETAYKILEEKAKRKGKSIEEIIIESILDDVEPAQKVKIYLELHEKYLKEAEKLHRSGDLAQSGEKYWGALTALINAIGELKGLPHTSHRDLREIIEELVEETGDLSIARLYSSAETLHANFYHNFLRKKTFDAHKEDTLKLINKLRAYIETKHLASRKPTAH